jgi:hypothetical protein
MGVESNFYVLPNASGFRPSAAKVCELITRLRATSYFCDPQLSSFEPLAHRCPPALKGMPGYEGFNWRVGNERCVGSLRELEKRLTQLDAADVLLRWPNTDLQKSGLKYPLSKVPDSEGVYYDIEIHLSADTVYHTSEIVESFEEPIHCACGAVLKSFESPGYDFFCSSRLPNLCPTCGKTADYSVLPMTVRDGWTGKETQGLGGITYRFCVQIECGKMIPEAGTTVLPDFRQMVEHCLECQTRVVQDFH